MSRDGIVIRGRSPDFTSVGLASLAALFVSGLAAILFLWIREAWPALAAYGGEIVSGREWFYRDRSFGAAAMIYGSVAVSVIALLLAAPVAFAAAVFISECLPASIRPWTKSVVEFLAAIPSVVYGLRHPDPGGSSMTSRDGKTGSVRCRGRVFRSG